MSKETQKESFPKRILTWVIAVVLIVTLFALVPCIGIYWLWQGIVLTITAIRSGAISIGTVFALIISCVLCFICFSVEWKIISFVFAKYEFYSYGVEAKYFGRHSQIIPWDDFQEVCICYADYNCGYHSQLTKVICLIKKGEKKNIFGRWKVDNFLRYRSVIRLDYSPELHQKVIDVCPYHIVDYCRSENTK